MKYLLSKIVERARRLSAADFAAEVAEYRNNEFAKTLRALDFLMDVEFFKFGKSFEIKDLAAVIEVKDEDFHAYEFVEAANDLRFCLAA